MFTRKVFNYFLININLYLNDFKQIYIQVYRLNSFKVIKILPQNFNNNNEDYKVIGFFISII